VARLADGAGILFSLFSLFSHEQQTLMPPPTAYTLSEYTLSV